MTKSPCKTKRPEGLSFCFGRGGRNRTLIKGFGDLCSTTEPRPYGPIQASGIITLIKVGYKEQKGLFHRRTGFFGFEPHIPDWIDDESP